MGFWGNLIKGAGIAAAPFTGGASLLATALPVAGQVASGILDSRSKGRQQAADTNMSRDQLAMQSNRDYENALMQRELLDLKQREMDRSARATDSRDAVRGALLKNVQDVSMDRPAGVPVMKFAGGLRPSALGEEGRAAGDVLNQRAMAALMAGEKFDELPALQRSQLSALPQSGFWDKLLGGVSGAGLVAAGANAVRDNLPQNSPTVAAQFAQNPDLFKNVRF